MFTGIIEMYPVLQRNGAKGKHNGGLYSTSDKPKDGV